MEIEFQYLINKFNDKLFNINTRSYELKQHHLQYLEIHQNRLMSLKRKLSEIKYKCTWHRIS